MSDKKSSKPFESLGRELQSLRTKRQESLIEVSGAVEIDSDQLSMFESGSDRPSQEILALLMSHFDIRDDESAKIWELAGYSASSLDENGFVGSDEQAFQTPIVSVMPMDARIIYTDLVHVMINNYGVVINFMQGAGPNNQPLAVSRVGMSKEHAKSLLEVLKNTIEQSDNPPPPKQLPESSKKSTTDDKTHS